MPPHVPAVIMQSFKDPLAAARRGPACRGAAASPFRSFSSSPAPRTRLRENMFRWLDGPGKALKSTSDGGPRYLGSQVPPDRVARHNQKLTEETNEDEDIDDEGDDPTSPRPRGDASARRSKMKIIPFPTNLQFKSDPVLSEELRDHISRRVIVNKDSVRRVSADLHVEMRRVGAVIRLKNLEKDWEEQGKRLATPYARAVLSMLPQTPLTNPATPHESINDLPTHKATLPQIFHIASESRRFTRSDAGKAFAAELLPSDERVPHPQLVQSEKPTKTEDSEARQRVVDRSWAAIEESDRVGEERRLRLATKAEQSTITVRAGRWDFKFKDVTVDQASVGRHVKGTGARYGVPAQDRKKGQVKIPTRVE